MIRHIEAPQGSPEWFAARRGAITGSRFRDARNKLKSGEPSKAAMSYAMDVARERIGGSPPSKFETWAMRQGREQEPIAAARYEVMTGNMVDICGFFVTEDGRFGLSPDRLIEDDGVLEIKTIVSSEVLYNTVARGDVSDYIDQCTGYHWLLGRQWVDLALWVPDLDRLFIQRIDRDEKMVEALEADLLTFDAAVASMVEEFKAAFNKEKA